MDIDIWKGLAFGGVAVIGFFLRQLHGKVDRAASKADLLKLETDTREDIKSRRDIEGKLFDELALHIAEDTRRFADVLGELGKIGASVARIEGRLDK